MPTKDEVVAAVKGSIEKWERIAERKEEDKGTMNCPLCQMFLPSCRECPVGALGHNRCYKTPYDEWSAHQCNIHDSWGIPHGNKCKWCTRYAKQEVKFLKGVLRKVKKGEL